MKRKVKISDIARLSGVSMSTVSLALNNKPGVAPETYSRVLEIAGEMGYPSKPAANRISPILTTIGMVVKNDPDIPPQANPFYSKVIVGIENGCRGSKINLLFATVPVDENNRPLEVPHLLDTRVVDGLLLVGACLDHDILPANGDKFPPIVLVDGYSASENYDSVVSDNFNAARQAVEYLIHKGHRQIALVGGEENCFASLKDRRNGYLRALKDNGLADPHLVNFNINKTHGYQEICGFLSENPQVTALFCINDDTGNVAIRAAHDLGRRVPADLSIVGYDDTYIASNSHPAMTTMHVDTLAMGHAAVSLLALRLDQPDSARMTLTIHATLVERDTVAQPPTSL